jgi:beta-galactosidase GanA
MVPEDQLQEYLLEAAADAGILPETDLRHPLICRNAADKDGRRIHFLFNYSSDDQSITCPWNGEDLLTGKQFVIGQSLSLPDWGIVILKENADD